MTCFGRGITLIIEGHANAKINLTLRITGKDELGYHKLQSVFVFPIDVFDTLLIDTEKEFDESSGYILGVDSVDNSVRKAGKILMNTFQRKLPYIEIEKRIPIGSGLGGGSSDAARFIEMVFNIWDVSIKDRIQSIKFFNPLGSDTIIFLYQYLQYMDTNALFIDGTGIDGIVRPISIRELRHCYIVVVNDGTFLSTECVYDNFTGPFQPTLDITMFDFNYLKDYHNSLQKSSISLVPQIQNVLLSIEVTNPYFFGVSGSGSSCFGLYDSLERAKGALKSLSIYGYRFLKMSRI
jgi:4-diphosphocytidyl-2-C-methyl-D-erythritol kinase